MQRARTYLIVLASFAAVTCPADYLGDSKTWCGKWRSIENGSYRVDINYAGEMGVTVGDVNLALGQLQGRWREQNFSTHHNLHGKGPWQTVEARLEKNGDTTQVTVKGSLADLTVVETLVAGPDTITYRWQGRVTDPTPELSWINFGGAVYTWRNPQSDPPCKAVTADGRSTAFRLRSSFGELVGVERFEFEVGATVARVEFRRTRGVRFKRDQRRKQIPVRYDFKPEGAAHLTPGAEFAYEMHVTVRPVREAR